MVLKAPKADSMRLRMWKQRMRLCDRLRVEKRERERERERERKRDHRWVNVNMWSSCRLPAT